MGGSESISVSVQSSSLSVPSKLSSAVGSSPMSSFTVSSKWFCQGRTCLGLVILTAGKSVTGRLSESEPADQRELGIHNIPDLLLSINKILIILEYREEPQDLKM